MSKPVVLFVSPINEELDAYHDFVTHFDVVFYRLTTREQLIHDLKEDPQISQISAVYAGFRGFQPVGGLIDADLLAALPNSLKIITLCSAGYNGYDLAGLREKGVDLCNTPNFGATQVAETALYHIINGFRKFHIYEQTALDVGDIIEARGKLQDFSVFDREDGRIKPYRDEKTNPWFAFGERVASNLYSRTPSGKTITIVGSGQIGLALGGMVHTLGMKIRFVNRHGMTEAEKNALGYPVEVYTELQTATAGSDCIALCVPSTPQTKGMLNWKVIEKVNRECCVVNVGRGDLIVDSDLLKGLKCGLVGHAGLDVLEKEPKLNPQLASRQDVTITPHLGSSTEENYDNTQAFCLTNISAKLTSGTAHNVQN